MVVDFLNLLSSPTLLITQRSSFIYFFWTLLPTIHSKKGMSRRQTEELHGVTCPAYPVHCHIHNSSYMKDLPLPEIHMQRLQKTAHSQKAIPSS